MNCITKKAILAILSIAGISMAIFIGAYHSNDFPVGWESYQGIVVGETSLAETENLLGKPSKEERTTGEQGKTAVIYYYNDFTILGVDGIVQNVTLKNSRAPGVLGELNVKIGDEFCEVYDKLPEKQIKKLKEEDIADEANFTALKKKQFVIYLFEYDATKAITIVLNNGVVV